MKQKMDEMNKKLTKVIKDRDEVKTALEAKLNATVAEYKARKLQLNRKVGSCDSCFKAFLMIRPAL